MAHGGFFRSWTTLKHETDLLSSQPPLSFRLYYYIAGESCVSLPFSMWLSFFPNIALNTQVKDHPGMDAIYESKVFYESASLDHWSQSLKLTVFLFFFFLVQEYETAFQLIRLCFPNERIKYDLTNPDWFCSSLLPFSWTIWRSLIRAADD